MPTSKKTNQLRCTPLNKKKCGQQPRCAWLPSKGCRAAGTQAQLKEVLDDKLTDSVLSTFRNDYDMDAEQTRAMAIAELMRNAPGKNAKQAGCTKYSKNRCNTFASCEWKEGTGCRKTFSTKRKAMKAALPMESIQNAMKALGEACQQRYEAEKDERKLDKQMTKLKKQLSDVEKRKDKDTKEILSLTSQMAEIQKKKASGAMSLEKAEKKQARIQQKTDQVMQKKAQQEQKVHVIKQQARQVNSAKQDAKTKRRKASKAEKKAIVRAMDALVRSGKTSKERAKLRAQAKQLQSEMATQSAKLHQTLSELTAPRRAEEAAIQKSKAQAAARVAARKQEDWGETFSMLERTASDNGEVSEL